MGTLGRPASPAGPFYVTRHEASNPAAIFGETFSTRADADLAFDSYDNGDLATGLWDSRLNEIRYYGARGQRVPGMMDWVRAQAGDGMLSTIYFITRHESFNPTNILVERFGSRAEADAAFNRYENGELATGLFDAQRNEIRYYGNRGARVGQMLDWIRDHSTVAEAQETDLP